MKPGEIVSEFASLTASCIDLLREHYDGLERTSAYGPAGLIPRDGSARISSGSLGAIGRFDLHGRGCRFELATGEDLDVDWDAEGRAVFDSWRILMYARSIGIDSIDRESLRLAAAADPLLRQVQDDWFTWSDRRYDVR